MCICVGDLHQKRPACYEKTLLIPQIIGAKGPHLPSLLNPFLQMLPCPLGIGLSVCVLWEPITASGSGSMRIARRWTDTWASCACMYYFCLHLFLSLTSTHLCFISEQQKFPYALCVRARMCVCVCVIQLTCGLDFLWGQTHANAGRLVLNRGCCDPALKLKHTLLLKQRNLMDMFVFWINDGVLWLLGGGLQIQNLKKERKSQM